MVLANTKVIVLIGYSIWVASSASAGRAGQAPPIRVALIGMSGQGGLSAVRELERALAADARIALVDASLVNAATTGIGYTGSTNMSRAEAGQLGAAIGCDFFITGVARTATRSVRAAESHEETIIGLMLVDGRTGALVAFDFIAKTGPDQISASDAAIKTLASRAVEYVDRAAAYHASRTAITSGPDTQRGRETIEDLPEPDSLRAQGFVPPEFTNRVKPHYSDEADRADISATVEASVVFLSNGEVGETEITRWAGFGLDESAISAIKQLKFKPATRDGNPVSVRALVQYNFRRSSGDVAPSLPRPVPEERKAPDLRELFKPKYVRPSASQ